MTNFAVWLGCVGILRDFLVLCVIILQVLGANTSHKVIVSDVEQGVSLFPNWAT